MLPRLIVFDCDACLWTPECFQIQGPFHKVSDDCILADKTTVRLFPGALHAFREILHHPDFQTTKIALASTTRYPSHSKVLREGFYVAPGKSIDSVVCSTQVYYADSKVGHFESIKKETGIEYHDMLFFDDCIWGDNVGDVESGCPGVVGIRTPQGMTIEKWKEGLAEYARRNAKYQRS